LPDAKLTGELAFCRRPANSRPMLVQPSIRVWALLGSHRGDNNQILALAEALGFGFEEKHLRHNQLRRLQPALLGATFASLDSASRKLVEGEPPALTISTGHRSVPAVRELKRRSGGRMRAVHLGYPRLSPRHFDLVVPTTEYPVPDGPNVLRIPFALSPHSASISPAPEDRSIVERLPRPRLLLVVGGPTLYWELSTDRIHAALRKLLSQAAEHGGSVLVTGSPRTPDRLLRDVERELESTHAPSLIAPTEGPPSYRTMIDAADAIFVTADSVAMVADAVTTGKPVGIVPIDKSALGRIVMGLGDRTRPGKRLFPRDLRFFWAALEREGFGGTLEQPHASKPPDYTAIVAERVKRLLGPTAPPATGDRDSDR
jgi:mitochondrial fission protein ELM1